MEFNVHRLMQKSGISFLAGSVAGVFSDTNAVLAGVHLATWRLGQEVLDKGIIELGNTYKPSPRNLAHLRVISQVITDVAYVASAVALDILPANMAGGLAVYCLFDEMRNIYPMYQLINVAQDGVSIQQNVSNLEDIDED